MNTNKRIVERAICKIQLCMIGPVAGGGGRTRGQAGVYQRAPVGFQGNRPQDTPHRTIGTTPPRERGRPARILSLGLPLGFPAMR